MRTLIRCLSTFDRAQSIQKMDSVVFTFQVKRLHHDKIVYRIWHGSDIYKEGERNSNQVEYMFPDADKEIWDEYLLDPIRKWEY